MNKLYFFLCLVFYDSIMLGEASRGRWGENPEMAEWRRLCRRIRATLLQGVVLLIGWAVMGVMSVTSADPLVAAGVGGMSSVFATIFGWGALAMFFIVAILLAYAYARAHDMGLL